MGLPVEVYTNGTQQWASIISVIGVGLALHYLYLPVFCDLQCITCFTYLELRFDKRVKNLVSLLYTVSILLYIPTVIYIPAIAFNQGMYMVFFFGQFVSYLYLSCQQNSLRLTYLIE